MLHYPDTMRKAQAEIDAVVGSSRMPNFDDAGSATLRARANQRGDAVRPYIFYC